jgi:ribonuclease VapC
VIVDTSALIAVLQTEPGHERIEHALLQEHGLLPAPALLEYRRVTSVSGNRRRPAADRLLEVLAPTLSVVAFTAEDALLAVEANEKYGSGNGSGGALNLLDLMVYGAARARSMPILCTGKDFAATDANLHPASRTW